MNTNNNNAKGTYGVAYHFTRERVQSGELKVLHCPTSDMTADILTKGLARVQFQKLRDALGVCDCNL